MVSSRSAIFSGAGFVFIGIVIEMGLSFFGQLIIARELGRVSYGAVSIGTTVLTFGVTITILGLNTGLARNISRAGSNIEERTMLNSALVIAGLTSLTGAVVLYATSPTLAVNVFGDGSLTPILRLFAVVLPVAVLFRVSLGGIRGYSMTRGRIYAQNITLPVSRIVGIAVAILLGGGALAVAGAYTFAYIIAAAVAFGVLIRHTPIGTGAVSSYREQSHSLLSYSLPLILSTSMTRIYTQADVLLLGASSVGTGGVGVYRVVYPLAGLLTTSSLALGYIYLPEVSSLHDEDNIEEIRSLFKLTAKWITIAGLPIILAFLTIPREILTLLYGQEYTSGAVTLQVVSIGFFLSIAAGPNAKTLMAFGETRYVAVVDTITAATNVVLNLLLIPQLGILGAGIATVISYVVQNMLYSGRIYYKNKLSPLSWGMVIPTGICLAFGFGILLVDSVQGLSTSVRVGGYLIALGTVVLVSTFVSIGDPEKEMISEVFSRIRGLY
ncbi:flippase [Halobaculum roseum]|uniref:Flippase n=1 Tax=Halobaculum roseum TaxID=2175149 RepID=A0ABD5MG99_9EURY|nr:flippase [Halobaculum roseum]QZY02526.1 flippase [Halobaculum roseum]